jgi:anti-sigma regulatory factor (Ser/Thr protein kinase)
MDSVITRRESIQDASVLVPIDEQSATGGARRMAVALAGAHGVSADAIGRLAIVVTEAATNILQHAGRGTIILRAVLVGDAPGIEMLALDKGPGIPDVSRAMRDGFSTSGTAGQGLGGMRRLAQVFDIYSQRAVGTALLARIGDEQATVAPSIDDRVGAICIPVAGQVDCGDAWRVMAHARDRTTVMVVDGLGHGPHAATAAAAATALFPSRAHDDADVLLGALDEAMRGTRGAALSVTVIDPTAREAQFSGVGNVDGRVIANGKTSHLVPRNGIMGHTMPTVRASVVPWPAGARLIMHSDGVSARWHMDAYPGLLAAHPAIVAGVIYRDFARSRDDATVIVLADDTPQAA